MDNIIDSVTMNQIKEIDNEDHANKIIMYSFHDVKGNRYDTPFFCQNSLFAKRHYHMVINDKKSIISNFQSDFDLVCIGSYNLRTGQISHHDPIIVINGKKEVKNNEK
jgi:hypothetical protein